MDLPVQPEKQEEIDFLTKLDEIKVFGSLSYNAKQIADFLELTTDQRSKLIQCFEDPDHPVTMAYWKGFINAEYKTDAIIAKEAQAGDEKSIELQGERSRQRKLRELKRDLFGI